jgi:hypothetical protein
MVEKVSSQDLDAVRAHFPAIRHARHFTQSDAQFARMAQADSRQPDGSPDPVAITPQGKPEFLAGGSRLLSMGPDYLTFLRMVLSGGALNERDSRSQNLGADGGEPYW